MTHTLENMVVLVLRHAGPATILAVARELSREIDAVRSALYRAANKGLIRRVDAGKLVTFELTVAGYDKFTELVRKPAEKVEA